MFVGDGSVMGAGVPGGATGAVNSFGGGFGAAGASTTYGSAASAAAGQAYDTWPPPLSPGIFGKHSAAQPVTFGGAGGEGGSSSLFDVPMAMQGGFGGSPAPAPRALMALPSIESDDGGAESSAISSMTATAGGLYEPLDSMMGGVLQHQHHDPHQQQLLQQQQHIRQQQQLQYHHQQQQPQQQHLPIVSAAPSYQSSHGFGGSGAGAGAGALTMVPSSRASTMNGAAGLLEPLSSGALDLGGSAIPRTNDPKSGNLWQRRLFHAEQQKYTAQVAAGIDGTGLLHGQSAIVAYNPAAAAAAADNITIKQEMAGDGGSRGSAGGGGSRSRASAAAAAATAASNWDGKLPGHFNQLTDKQLTYISQPDLRRLIENAGLSKEEIQKVKDKRRKLKNRQSAKVAVGKKKIQFQGLAKSNTLLSATVVDLEKKNTQLKDQNERQKQELQQSQRTKTLYEQEIARLQQMVRQMGGAVASAGAGAGASAGAGAGAGTNA